MTQGNARRLGTPERKTSRKGQWETLVLRARRDAREQPVRYLKQTEVPGGGE